MAEYICANETNYTKDEVRSMLVQFERELLVYKVPSLLFLIVLIFVGIPGNLCVCYIYRSKFPPSTPRLFIITLALFDLLNCLVGMPFDIADLSTDYFLDVSALCKIVRFCNTFSACGSMLILSLISVDRYKKICKPFRKQMLVGFSRKCVVAIVFLAIIFSVPAFFIYGIHSKNILGLKTTDCSLDDAYRLSRLSTIYEIFLGIMCFSSIFMMVVLYTLIVFRILKQKRRRATLTSDGPHIVSPRGTISSGSQTKEGGTKTNAESETETLPRRFVRSISNSVGAKKTKKAYVRSSRMTFMMLIVTVTFIVGYTPHFGLQITRLLVTGFSDNLRCNFVGTLFYHLFLRSYFLNSSINPIIYSFFNKRFRTEVNNLFKKLCCIDTEDVTLHHTNGSES